MLGAGLWMMMYAGDELGAGGLGGERVGVRLGRVGLAPVEWNCRGFVRREGGRV